MPLRDDLLTPIPGPNPAGVDLRYDPLYDKIKEARREDDDAPQGDWQYARKTADWALVIKLASDALATRSKDLQLGAWLTEALLRREGFGGLRSGLGLLRSLLEQFWDNVYPEPEDGDLELRAAPLEWIGGSRMELAVKLIPLNRKGHDFFKYQESRLVGSEAEADADSAKKESREKAIAAGKLTVEDFDAGVDATPKAWYKELMADLDGCLETLQSLDEVGQEKFGDVAPNYARLRGGLEEVQRVGRLLLKKKLELDPDPVEVETVAAETTVAALTVANQPAMSQAFATQVTEIAPSAAAPIASNRTMAPEPSSPEDAAARVVSAARFLRRAEPHSPAPYLMLRGFRWGELRAQGTAPNPRLLEAPPTPVRTQLKGLLLDRKWLELLEAAEAVMGTPQGRGWLDLQRYAVTACERLGGDFALVALAIRGELKTLLCALPQLPDMTLMDDTPTANAETQAWLRDTILSNGDHPSPQSESATSEAPWATPARGDGLGRAAGDAHAYALAEARSGHRERAIEMLMRELEREKNPRGRFLRQTQIADVMVETGLEAIAKPILEELLAQIERHKLDEWEAGDVVAKPMALLYRCLDKLGTDEPVKQNLYLRICRLDPLQAIDFTRQ